MQDSFAYCTELVRTADRDRYVASLFAPAQHRGALCALYAFNVEVARVREQAREPLPGEIRLQWWSEVLRGERSGEAGANPVASALLATIERYQLASGELSDLVEARRFDLYDEPMRTLADLETYVRRTSSVLFAGAARILARVAAAPVTAPAGAAFALVGLMRALPLHVARRQLYLPLELLDRHGASVEDLFAGRAPVGLSAALAELRALARRHLAAVREQLSELPREALPALLPAAPVRRLLDRLERSDPLAPADIAPWRRQWLIWRAARDPARIAA